MCGDLILDPGETCDDGNLANSDGCDSSCHVEPGWSCDITGNSATPPTASVCTKTCGNGIREGSEECDDGNTLGSDGCSSTCTIETGWTCNLAVSPNTCSAICGNGRKDGTEVCDDGNTVSGDGCKNDCSAIENGWNCLTPAASLTTCSPICSATSLYVVGNMTCADGNLKRLIEFCSPICHDGIL